MTNILIIICGGRGDIIDDRAPPVGRFWDKPSQRVQRVQSFRLLLKVTILGAAEAQNIHTWQDVGK